ncbi:S8 family serine peptidase [Corynebacterium phocae]|uniref:S8 family serine peptidase n=1 Tax=Corynebacterium phocae TaxID=161895 RepID=UPI0009FD98B4|nr:S8 family serine peptidase [Corynebacterium phocae]
MDPRPGLTPSPASNARNPTTTRNLTATHNLTATLSAILLPLLFSAITGTTSAPAQEPVTPCAQPVDAAAPVATRAQEKYRSHLHSLATGAGIKVAVIDTGVSPHPQLPNLEAGPDFVAPDNPDSLFDCDFHGTVVAGVIASTTTGIAPGATIVSIRQSSAHYRSSRADLTAPDDSAHNGHQGPNNNGQQDPNNSGETTGAGTLASLASAIEAAVDANAQVINISVVSCVDPQTAQRIDTTVLDDALSRAEHSGAVVVASGGNSSNSCHPGDVVYPLHVPTVVSVAAVSSSHDIAPYSLAGAVSAPGLIPLNPAPGGGWASGSWNNNTANPIAGTSFAAPAISATAALLMQRHPGTTPEQIRGMLTAAAHPGTGYVDPLEALAQYPAPDTAAPAPARLVNINRPEAADHSANDRLYLLLGIFAAAATVTGLAAGLRQSVRRNT